MGRWKIQKSDTPLLDAAGVPKRETYSREEVAEAVAKMLRKAGVDPDALAAGDVERLDVDAARAQRQADLEKSLQRQVESGQSTIRDADSAVAFLDGTGRETMTSDVAVAKATRTSMTDAVFAEPTNPYAVPARKRRRKR